MSAHDSPARAGGFHAGERAMQARAGKAAAMAETGARVIRDHMPDQHRELFGQLPFVILGGLDARRQPWASILTGPTGFLSTPDARTMRVAALPGPSDALSGTLHAGAPVGLLGLQQHTRRRNRMNGRVTHLDATGFTVHVLESFGNCPKYIQAREARYVEEQALPIDLFRSSRLDAESRRIVAGADTLFIATAYPEAGTDPSLAYGADVSHRGGKPGFVRLSGDMGTEGRDVLTIPDFAGNSFFNTLGNIILNPRVGLLFIDFEGGHALQLAGTADIIHDGPELASYAGALRLLRISVDSVRRMTNALPMRWSRHVEQSPQLAATGEWSVDSRWAIS